MGLYIDMGYDTATDHTMQSCPDPGQQVRANTYILERPPLGVYSISMDQTHYLDRPERSG